jgi:hypothetical protein
MAEYERFDFSCGALRSIPYERAPSQQYRFLATLRRQLKGAGMLAIVKHDRVRKSYFVLHKSYFVLSRSNLVLRARTWFLVLR